MSRSAGASTVASSRPALGGEVMDDPIWLDPEPFQESDRPPFPVAVLPPEIAEFVEGVASATATPTDLAGMLAINAVALVCARKVEVSATWTEPVNLYTCVVLPPGERKSPVHTMVYAPVEALERRMVTDTADERDRLAAERRARIKLAQKAVADAKKAEDFEWLKRAELDVIEAFRLPEPVLPRLLAADVTPEAIPGLLKDHGGRIGIKSDEGGIFDTIAGRYASGVPNLDAVLKAHDGSSPIRVDRVGRHSEFVEKPAITFGLTVQPEVLYQIAAHKDFKGRGFSARFLWAVPDSKIGFRPTTTPPLPELLVNTWDSCLRRLNALEDVRLQLSLAALAAFDTFREGLEARMRPEADLGGIKEWVNKLAGALLRISALFHVVEHGTRTNEITAATLQRALGLSEYLIAHARIALDAVGMRSEMTMARRILAWIKRHGISSFTRRELLQDLSLKLEDAEPGLDVLMERGFIRQKPAIVGKSGGRPTIQFEAWPGLLQGENRAA